VAVIRAWNCWLMTGRAMLTTLLSMVAINVPRATTPITSHL